MNNIAYNIALPLLAAFVLPIINNSSKSAARLLGPFVLLAMVAFAGSNLYAVSHPVSIELGGFRPPLGINFYLDQLALLFALIIPLLMLVLWPWTTSQGIREEALLLLLAAAASGLALSGDLFNIYVFYELLSVASFGLVAANRSGAAFAASFRYLVISGLGTVLALVGIALIYTRTGTLNLAHIGQYASQLNDPIGLSAFALIVLGIGVKAEVFPLNSWVPEVYSSAPVRTVALLAGLVSKLAVLVLIRLLVVAYDGTSAYAVLAVLGMLGIVWGEFSAWRSQDMKRLLAYSSIGQLGLVLVAFSIPGPAGMIAGVAVMLHHMIIKPGLFLLSEHWPVAIDKLGELGRSRIIFGLYLFFALSLVGVPPLPGFWAKLMVVTGLADNASPLHLTALLVLLSATVVEAAYLMRVALRMGTDVGNPGSPATQSSARLPALALVFALLLAGSLLLLNPIASGLEKISGQSSDRALYMQTVLPDMGPGYAL
jgi:formate hydrogenlyase subunit 3/multisubunit Na+/H+ antiporter MnhD subunit